MRVIAIDGPAASGKSSTGALVAQRLGMGAPRFGGAVSSPDPGSTGPSRGRETRGGGRVVGAADSGPRRRAAGAAGAGGADVPAGGGRRRCRSGNPLRARDGPGIGSRGASRGAGVGQRPATPGGGGTPRRGRGGWAGHRHRRLSRRSAQGVSHRQSRRAGAPPAESARGSPRRRPRGAGEPGAGGPRPGGCQPAGGSPAGRG